MKVSTLAIAAIVASIQSPAFAKNLFDKSTSKPFDFIDKPRKGNDQPIVLSIKFKDQTAIQHLADEYDILGVDEAGMMASILVTSLEDKIELEEKYAGNDGAVVVDEAATAQFQESISQQYYCYRTVEETHATGESVAANYPDIAEWIDIGDSWEKTQNRGGYDIYALKLTNKSITVAGGKPKFFANCAIHAQEYATAELCTRFAEMLVSEYGSNADITTLLDHQEVHLVLQTNPDGRKEAEAGKLWRKNKHTGCKRKNDLGVDLNRNFPYRWGQQGASSNQCSGTYRGKSPASEPETQAVLGYMDTIFPTNQRGENPTDNTSAPDTAMGVAIDVHAETTPSPNSAQFTTLARKLAYFNNYDPKPSWQLYTTSGTTKDSYYGNYGVAAFTFELGTAFFQDCPTFENKIVPDNLNSLLYAAMVSRTPYKTPAGPDALDLRFLGQTGSPFKVGETVTIMANIDDTRYSSNNGVEGTQNIASASVYIDVLPWDEGATPDATMTASDNFFDTGVEGVEASIDTSSMDPGKHTIYVVGTDANGDEGLYSAIFLELIRGTCVDAGAKNGDLCLADSDCCGARQLRGLIQDSQGTPDAQENNPSKHFPDEAGNALRLRGLQGCENSPCQPGNRCCQGFVCDNQGGGIKICVQDSTSTDPPTPGPTPSPSPGPTLSQKPSTSLQPSEALSESPSLLPSTSAAPSPVPVCKCAFTSG